MRPKQYIVDVERDADGRWVGTISSLKAFLASGRTLADFEQSVHDSLAACGASDAIIDYAYPAEIDRLIRAADDARGKATSATSTAAEKMADAVRDLDQRGISRRDAAALLNLSHQRV